MLSQNATTRNSLLQVSRVITIRNYEKHALRVSRVIAVLAKSACKHAIFLATRVKKKLPVLYRPPKVRPKNLTIGGRYFYG